jgi:hypothetical protein
LYVSVMFACEKFVRDSKSTNGATEALGVYSSW